MSSTASTESQSPRLRQWQSLTGIVPLGGFLALHLALNARVLFGDDPYQWQMQTWVVALEILLVYLPLTFHAAYGLYVSFTSPESARNGAALGRRSTTKPDDPSDAWWLRATGLVTFVFIAFHLYQFRYRVLSGQLRRTDLHSELCALMSSTTELGIPVMAMTYLFGLATTTIHFSIGLRRYAQSRDSFAVSRFWQWTSVSARWIGAALFTVGALSIVQLATGSWLIRL